MKNVMFFVLIMCIVGSTKTVAQVKWDYPIGPSSSEWINAKTMSERLSFYNIPEELLVSMSTKELLTTCLSYPEWRLIFTRNSLAQGYIFIKGQFNGFNELEKRPDAGLFLLEHYSKINHDDVVQISRTIDIGQFMNSILKIEILLSQEPIIQNMTNLDRIKLKSLAINSFEKEDRLKNYFSLFPLEYPALILAKLLKKRSESDSELRAKLDEEILIFAKTSSLYNPELWFRIHSLAKANL